MDPAAPPLSFPPHTLRRHSRRNPPVVIPASKARVRIGGADWRLIEWLLQEKWSPEQISLWLGENGRVSVSHEWIYRYRTPGCHSRSI